MNDLECIAQIWQTLVNYIYYLCIIFFTDIIHSGESLSVKKAVKLPTQGLCAMNRYHTYIYCISRANQIIAIQ